MRTAVVPNLQVEALEPPGGTLAAAAISPWATRQRSLGMMRSGDWRRCWSLTDLGRFTIVRQRCIQLHGAVAEVAPVGRAQQALPCGVRCTTLPVAGKGG